jgi:RHS repeat-associated protein
MSFTRSANVLYNFYNADGVKFRDTISAGNFSGVYDYIGPYVYKNRVLSYINTSEGRAVYTSAGVFSYYEYYIKDHLGNVRTVFKRSGTSYTTLQESNYYPFGALMGSSTNTTYSNRYLYNGKEQIGVTSSTASLDLSLYDYGARFYDPQLGRFHTVDAFAEKYLSMAPYQYGANNPISFIDINGDSLDITDISQNNAATTDMNAMVDKKTNGYYTTTTTAGGMTVIQSTGKNDPNNPISAEGQAFVDEFNKVANSAYITKINITDNDQNITIVDGNSATIDIGDLKSIDDKNLPSKSGSGMMMHEIVEQQGIQNGGTAAKNPQLCHLDGIHTENVIDNSHRVDIDLYAYPNPNSGNPFMPIRLIKGGVNKVVTVTFQNNNVKYAIEK